MSKAGPVLAAAALAASLIPPGPAAAAPQPEPPEESEKAAPDGLLRSVAVGLTGSLEREGNTRSYNWGPTLSVGVVSSPETAATRFKYELEYAYDDAYSQIRSEEGDDTSRVRTSEFKYAKISLLRLRGRDLKESLRFVPYVAGGIQYADSDETTNGETTRSHYWSPTWGAGLELTLTKKTTLGLDYEQNTERGSRRISRLNLELKLNVFGDPDE